ncbi:MAG: methionyl-tRNA formyltransferase [Patescibacteria group bacterium]|nr:methionyl-tRNA formyltransferase [Patescibacteria group bacterium]MDE1941020.1 methionyl-tRNA formyltransferase [Patescibacteria group bacterium]MDE1967051.1 methionyl-tRNA formyltransferase [Patescibacteria group bacterium]
MSVSVLDELKSSGLVPSIIVTTPDKPRGRKLILSPNVVKSWGLAHDIKVFDFAKLDADAARALKEEGCAVFIVASYGKLLPPRVLEIPEFGLLNIHPSLLPKYRGPSPLQSAILADDKRTGVTIMKIDEEMDHGPIVAQKAVAVDEWPVYEIFEDMMARQGAKLLAEILDDWLDGKIEARLQDDSLATYTKKFEKADGLLDLSGDPYLNFRKIQAFHEWPQAYFMLSRDGRDIRVKVTEASFASGRLEIVKVIPEGGREMSYKDFRSGYQNV